MLNFERIKIYEGRSDVFMPLAEPARKKLKTSSSAGGRDGPSGIPSKFLLPASSTGCRGPRKTREFLIISNF